MPKIDINKVAEILRNNDLDPATLRRIVEEMDAVSIPQQFGHDISSEAALEGLRSAFKEKERQERSHRLRGAIFAAVVATSAAAGLVTLLWNPSDNKTIPEQFGQTSKVLTSQQNEIDKLMGKISEISTALALKPVPSSQDALGVEQTRLSAAVQKLDTRLSSLEAGLQETPEKALSVPLIRKDLSDLERRMVESRAMDRSEIDRIHDEQKWILGGIGAAALAVLVGSIKIILNSLPKKANDE